jgi:hypothetical protein
MYLYEATDILYTRRIYQENLSPGKATRSRKGQDPARGMFGRGHNHGGRVSGHHAREYGRVDDEEILGSVDLGVKVNHGRTTLQTAVGAQLGSTWFQVSQIDLCREGEGGGVRKTSLPIQWLARRVWEETMYEST